MNGVYNGGAGGSHHEPDPALYAWAEVTGSFLASCQELQLGELLHDDMFGLFEVGFFPCVVDPDPQCIGCPGSGSVLEMRSQIQEHGNLPKFINKPNF